MTCVIREGLHCSLTNDSKKSGFLSVFIGPQMLFVFVCLINLLSENKKGDVWNIRCQ